MVLISFFQRLPPKTKSVFFMLLWALLFSLSTATIKTIGPCVQTTTILLARTLFGFFIVAPAVLSQGIAPLKTTRKFGHLFRILTITSAIGCAMYAYQRLPLATTTAIGMSAPLFTTLFASLFLRERITGVKVLVLIAGYLGVLCIARPDHLMVNAALGVAVLANVSASAAMVTTKFLTKTEGTGTLMLYASAGTLTVATLLAYAAWEMPAANDILLLMMISVFGVTSQYCSITALRYADASFLAPIEYTRLCFAIPVGYFVFHESPTLLTWGGTALIVLATFALTRIDRK